MCGCDGSARECLLARFEHGEILYSGPRAVCGCDCHGRKVLVDARETDYDLQEYRSALRRMAAKIAGGTSADTVAKASINIARTIIDQVAKVDEVPDSWREQA